MQAELKMVIVIVDKVSFNEESLMYRLNSSY